MRVATLNVWNRSGDWPRRRKVLADGLRRLGPDLITLQETVVADGYDQAAPTCSSTTTPSCSRQAARQTGWARPSRADGPSRLCTNAT